MGRTAMNTDNEIRVATLKLAAEMKKDPRLVPVLLIMAALGGGTFSRIKRIRDSIQLPDEIRPPVREDHPDDEALDKPRDPVEAGMVNLKVRISRARARELGRAIKREVRELIQSDEFKERIASEARERAAELIQAVFAEANTLHKLSDVGLQSVARSIALDGAEFLDPRTAERPSEQLTMSQDEARDDTPAMCKGRSSKNTADKDIDRSELASASLDKEEPGSQMSVDEGRSHVKRMGSVSSDALSEHASGNPRQARIVTGANAEASWPMPQGL